MDTLAYIGGLALSFIVVGFWWLLWMLAGAYLILRGRNNPTGGNVWTFSGGLAMMLSGLIALGLGIYWLVVQ